MGLHHQDTQINMLASLTSIEGIFQCPRTGQLLTRHEDGSYVTKDGVSYASAGGVPILVDFDRSILDKSSVMNSAAQSPVERRVYTGLAAIAKNLVSVEKQSTRDCVCRLMNDLSQLDNPRALVVGGGSIGSGMQPLYDSPSIEVVSFDIYRSTSTQFVADAHQIPLQDQSVDAVVIQAVLEHVIEPAIAVSEICRVLKDNGIVLAETPFMQQVHEGAYDFTRFSDSGHQWLFRHFKRVASGSSGGPGLVLQWSLDYFFRGLFRSRKAGKIVKLLTFWLPYFDRLIPENHRVDGASGCYFYGTKNQAAPRSQDDIVNSYQGAQ